MRQSRANFKRIVIKVGGSLFILPETIERIIGQIADLVRADLEVVVVSSGAIACGMSILGLKEKPKELSYLQATAALGQNALINIYCRGLGKQGLNCGQVLLTWEDFNARKRYINAKNTILSLIKLGIVPIVNENDTVSVDEIKFGDNDRLSALVANLIEADLLIILSDIDGLLSKDKKVVVAIVDEINDDIRRLACPTDKKFCTGGMISKLEAAQLAVDSGLSCVIANGRKKGIISSILDSPQTAGTLFLPKGTRLLAKKRWIAFGTKSKGKIWVDSGAKEALVKNHKSLLSVGIKEVEGHFNAADTVLVCDDTGSEFGRGKVAYSADELRKIKGKKAKEEVIHRDNLVIVSRRD